MRRRPTSEVSTVVAMSGEWISFGLPRWFWFRGHRLNTLDCLFLFQRSYKILRWRLLVLSWDKFHEYVVQMVFLDMNLKLLDNNVSQLSRHALTCVFSHIMYKCTAF